MLKREDTLFVLVDLQERLLKAIHDNERLTRNVQMLVRGMRVLGVPMLYTEQNPDGLGHTPAEVARLLPGEPIVKFAFGCCAEPAFVSAVDEQNRRQIVLAGIESHVCVYQTAAGLLERDCEVEIVSDAVGSRTPQNRTLGLEKARALGAAITGIETVLFELLGDARAPEFKQLLSIVK